MKFATFAVALAIASPTIVSANANTVDELIAIEQQILAEEKALLSQQTVNAEADIAAAEAELEAKATDAMSTPTLVPMKSALELRAGHVSAGEDDADSWHSGTEPTHVTHDGSHHDGMSKEEYKERAKAAKKQHPSKSEEDPKAHEVEEHHKTKASKHGKSGKRGKSNSQKHNAADAPEMAEDGLSGGAMETAAADGAAMSMPAADPPAEPPVEEAEEEAEEEDAAVVEPPAANSTRVGVDTSGISKASTITAEQEARANVQDMVSTAMITGQAPGHHGSNHQAKKGSVESAAAELERAKSTDAKAIEASGSAAERSFRLGVALCLGAFVYAAGR